MTHYTNCAICHPLILPIGVIHWFGKKVQPQNIDAGGRIVS